jgi:hypothetical protein
MEDGPNGGHDPSAVLPPDRYLPRPNEPPPLRDAHTPARDVLPGELCVYFDRIYGSKYTQTFDSTARPHHTSRQLLLYRVCVATRSGEQGAERLAAHASLRSQPRRLCDVYPVIPDERHTIIREDVSRPGQPQSVRL